MGMIKSKVQTIVDTYSFDHVYYQIAQYLLKHLDDVYNMTLTSLATSSFTSRSSVLKFCHDMGFESWKVFISHLASEIEDRKSLNNIIEMNVSLNLDRDYPKMTRNQEHYFQEYDAGISHEVIGKIGQDIVQAKRLLICGEDNFCLCLREFQTFLSFQGKEVYIRSMLNKKDINHLLDTFDKDDLIFIIAPNESFESLLESHEFDEIIQFKQLMNIPIQKVFIGQKSILNIKYLGCTFIGIPYTTDYYLYLFAIIDFVYKLSFAYLQAKNINNKK